MSNPELQSTAEKETELAKIREVQERIRREVNPQALDVETIVRINEIIVEEAGKYKDATRTMLQYDIAFPFVRDEIIGRMSVAHGVTDELFKTFGESYNGDENSEMLRITAELDYLQKYGEQSFDELVSRLMHALTELVGINREASAALVQKLKHRGYRDMTSLANDGTSNVIAGLYARYQKRQLWHQHGKSYQEILEGELNKMRQAA